MRNLVLLGCVLLLGACSSTCLQNVAATEVAITQAYDKTADLLRAEVIDKGEAKVALKSIDGANVLTNNAATLCRIDDAKASDYLNQAGKALSEASSIIGD